MYSEVEVHYLYAIRAQIGTTPLFPLIYGSFFAHLPKRRMRISKMFALSDATYLCPFSKVIDIGNVPVRPEGQLRFP